MFLGGTRTSSPASRVLTSDRPNPRACTRMGDHTSRSTLEMYAKPVPGSERAAAANSSRGLTGRADESETRAMTYSPEDTIGESLEETLDKATEWLHELPDTWDESTAGEALVEVLVWVDVVNERWAAADAAPSFSRRQTSTPGALTGDVIKSLRKWIERLMAKLRDVVRSMPEAQSFSITGGIPPLAVTVTFVPATSA